jgi:hypothetical protein
MELSGQLHAPTTLLQGKSPWYPLDRRLGGPQSRPGRGGEEKNSQPLPGLEPPIIQPLAQRYTAELSRLLMMMMIFFQTGVRQDCLFRLHFMKFMSNINNSLAEYQSVAE